MNAKILQSNTIIPSNLYVERHADRQLQQIIEHMGRPGYVLVARQMGKTNLLINMKRRHAEEIVLYLDLSNRFDSPRTWFRNVIDSLLEAYPNELGGAQNEILDSRESRPSEPNIEYDRHLRTLLRTTNKKIIIILDEIDSLVNTTYSDSILSQVRSMYFSRTNHPEYDRLTYVLSGVAEPSDLIKDKNISPFNIGEKIYLEDFSREEFDVFIEKSELDLTKQNADHIFSWTNGNPRTTWDICSAVEDLQLSGESLSPSSIDEVVRKLYLETFDRAPIDHIRTLAESDALVRDAIYAIHNKNQAMLSDKIKSKLYLSGIIRLNQNSEILIKNKIIESALSLDWLSQVSTSQKSPLEIADENYNSQNYLKAIEQYQIALTQPDIDETKETLARLNLALSYLSSNMAENALDQLEKCISITKEPAILDLANYYVGISHMLGKNFEKSVIAFKKLEDGNSPSLRRNAQLSQAAALLKIGTDASIEQSMNLNESLIDDLLKEGSTISKESRSLLVSAYFNKSKILDTLEKNREALLSLEEAIAVSKPETLPKLIIAKYKNPLSAAERPALIDFAATTIITHNLAPSADIDAHFGLDVNKATFTTILSDLTSCTKEYPDGYDRLLNYLGTTSIYRGMSKFDIIADLLNHANSENETKQIISILEASAAKGFYNAPTDKRIPFLRILASHTDNKKWSIEYLRIMNLNSFEIQIDDIHTLTWVALNLRKNKAFPELRSLFETWRTFEKEAHRLQPVSSIAIKYQEMLFLREAGAVADAKEIAKDLIPLIKMEKNKTVKPHGYDENFMTTIRTHATQVLTKSSDPSARLDNIGRNQIVLVRYKKESPIRKKFKHVEEDIRSGKCWIISVEQ